MAQESGTYQELLNNFRSLRSKALFYVEGAEDAVPDEEIRAEFGAIALLALSDVVVDCLTQVELSRLAQDTGMKERSLLMVALLGRSGTQASD